MRADYILQELELVKAKHKDRLVGVGSLSLHAMCDDCARKIKELTDFKIENKGLTLVCKDSVYKVYDSNGLLIAEFPATF